MSKVKTEFSIDQPQFLPCAHAKISVETYFSIPDTFCFLQYGQIQPPSIVFAELKLSGLFGLRLRTDGHTHGHHNIVPTPTQLS